MESNHCSYARKDLAASSLHLALTKKKKRENGKRAGSPLTYGDGLLMFVVSVTVRAKSRCSQSGKTCKIPLVTVAKIQTTYH